MPEELIWFTNEGMRLYGMLHLPEGDGPHPGVMILHGFTGHRIEPHRLFVKLARRLAAEGLAAFRFDFRGSGESEGEFADATVLGEVSDALAGLEWLAARPEIDASRLGVLGLSLGGCVAALTAGRRPDRLQALVLWAAVAHPQRLAERQRELPPEQQPLRVENGYDLGGNVVGDALLAELPQLRPLEEIARYTGPALIVHGTEDAIVPPSDADAYEAALGNRARKHWIAGADHTFNRVAWEQEAIAVSVTFLRDALLS